MESRGHRNDGGVNGRLAIARRSCDQCRQRKIGCDRGSPCSNCSSAHLSCIHSTIVSTRTNTRQRVLISAQYERKIDNIAKDVDNIKLLLQGFSVPAVPTTAGDGGSSQIVRFNPRTSFAETHLHGEVEIEPQWDQSPHIVDFIKMVVEEQASGDIAREESEVTKSLKSLLRALECAAENGKHSSSNSNIAKAKTSAPTMPPQDAVVAVLRWAKDHSRFYQLTWISQVLPLEMFAEKCRNVYFAMDDYDELDFILANGYLSYIFAEHAIFSGREDYKTFCLLCQKNLEDSLSSLPLVLPPSMEGIAALTLGSLNAMENSKATVAWTYLRVAVDHSLRLNYHRPHPHIKDSHPLVEAQRRLFWVLHRMDKGISMRLGRSPNIRDDEITLPRGPDEARFTRLASLQGKVYDELYSPVGLARLEVDRGRKAQTLALDLRGLLDETYLDLAAASEVSNDSSADPMRVIYLQIDLVCESSLLALILRAIPSTSGSSEHVSKECLQVAREVFDIHEQCMLALRNCKNGSFVMKRYINWAIVHVPFTPFSILYTRAVKVCDLDDLARLERFAASLQPSEQSSEAESITHPHRLYELLCQAARLHIDRHHLSASADLTLTGRSSQYLGDVDLMPSGGEAYADANEFLQANGTQTFDLSDWFYSDQQIMSFLDDSHMS